MATTSDPHVLRAAPALTDLIDTHVASLYGLSSSLRLYTGSASAQYVVAEIERGIAAAGRLRTRLA